MIRKAKRANIPLKIGMRGPSGSGKTFSSILLAKGLMGGSLEKVVVLDTENGSADLYSHLGDYSVMPFAPPFNPNRYVKAIDVAIRSGFECLIIDSTSHEWEACLEIHSSMTGNSFINWAKITPMHKEFVNKILQSPIHIIACMRTKQDYALEENDKGKMSPVKIGLKEVQRDGFEYDLSLSFNIEINHFATTSKDRTGLFANEPPFKICEETGKTIREWNNG